MKARARGKMPKIATIYDHQNDKAIISLANRNKTQSEYIIKIENFVDVSIF